MESHKQLIQADNEHTYEWTAQISSKNTQVNSHLFEIKSSPGLNFCISAEIKTNSTLLKIQVIKTYTKSAIAAIELKVADMPSIIKDVSEWKDAVVFDRIPIPCAADDCQKNTWNVCNLVTPDSHEFRIKIICSIIWHGFVDELLSPNLMEEMRKFMGKTDYSDIKICVRDLEINAHKVVLASQSSVFAEKIAMAEASEESTTHFIVLDEEHNIEVVNEMLTFLYYGKLEKAYYDYNIALKLFQAAGDVKIIKLKEVCGVILSNKLAVENVLMLLELARKYNSVILQQRAITFIINNRKLLFYNCL